MEALAFFRPLTWRSAGLARLGATVHADQPVANHALEAVGNVSASDMESMNVTLKRMERFWIDQVRFRL